MVQRTVLDRYVPRIMICETKPGTGSSSSRTFWGSSPSSPLEEAPPAVIEYCSTPGSHGSTEEPSTGVHGGISSVRLEGSGMDA